MFVSKTRCTSYGGKAEVARQMNGWELVTSDNLVKQVISVARYLLALGREKFWENCYKENKFNKIEEGENPNNLQIE